MPQDYETKVSVLGTNMISIFAGKDVVHPYRFQKNVRFEIPFTEYVSFVELIVEMGVQGVLYFKLQVYKTCLEKENIDLLRKYYLIDMSVAVLNEVALSNAYGYQATQITHRFDDLSITNCTYADMILHLREMPKELVVEVRDNLTSCSPRKIDTQGLSPHNKMCYFYAIFLWACAKSLCRDNYINMT